MFDDDILSLAHAVVADAAARGLSLATAESCTGGLVSAALTAVAGSSAVVERGLVTYSNRAKTELLGVPEAVIATHGAVSEETARAMAAGARSGAGVDVAVAVTGIAGPGGGSAEKPVGLVHFAAIGPGGLIVRRELFEDRGREAIRRDALRTALVLLLDRIAS